ncbi:MULTISPECIES: hypothetical protein [Methanobrevibacter]|uniref:Uncharacterized protein n=1 Tax=Methanobrevibacter gottschalkii DSM 11977 TaxID=1122229 RepID=A0A3N5B1G5_9EURY|nr:MULTISPECIES: hypothetical protein [Methanobrevibacter]RPF50999.1 hypothetical protein EDC42_1661 [Methanobrevibacter gottschalkii DSM 11977]
MQLITKDNNYRRINELLEKILDKTVKRKHGISQEQPIFMGDDKPITWTELKESETGTTWSQGNITLTALFKYNQGGFPRFI